MEAIFRGDFEGERDVLEVFEILEKDLDGRKIVFAVYEQCAYEGDALVVLKDRDGNLSMVRGSH